MTSKKTPEEMTEWQKSGGAFKTKQTSEYFDPCADFAERSRQCLHRNSGNKDLCTDYFNAYKECKKQWMAERAAEKKKKGLGWFS